MTSAANLYHSVIQDVISSVRDAFRDEMADENVLQELKNLWTSKLEQSKTIDPPNSRAGDALAQDRMAARASGGAQARPQPAAPQQLVITDPSRLVGVQITIPAQPGNASSQPRALTVHVPAHALQQQGPTSSLLQQVLTQAITSALNLPQGAAEEHLQSQINKTFNINQ